MQEMSPRQSALAGVSAGPRSRDPAAVTVGSPRSPEERALRSSLTAGGDMQRDCGGAVGDARILGGWVLVGAGGWAVAPHAEQQGRHSHAPLALPPPRCVV